MMQSVTNNEKVFFSVMKYWSFYHLMRRLFDIRYTIRSLSNTNQIIFRTHQNTNILVVVRDYDDQKVYIPTYWLRIIKKKNLKNNPLCNVYT